MDNPKISCRLAALCDCVNSDAAQRRPQLSRALQPRGAPDPGKAQQRQTRHCAPATGDESDAAAQTLLPAPRRSQRLAAAGSRPVHLLQQPELQCLRPRAPVLTTLQRQQQQQQQHLFGSRRKVTQRKSAFDLAAPTARADADAIADASASVIELLDSLDQKWSYQLS